MRSPYQTKQLLSCIGMIVILFCIIGCTQHETVAHAEAVNWCDKPLRPELKKLREVQTKRKWFKVYTVGANVYAIIEPNNFEEVISYLVLGKQKALLFDTGMGLDSISPLVKELTPLPVTVFNSHTHFDHIGGNHEFDNILAMNTNYSRTNAANGYAHHIVKDEVTPNAFCLQRLPKTDTAHYHTKPFKVSQFIDDGYEIDLGGRVLKVIAIPGHAPDAVALYDEQNDYLWTGDTFYEGPIWLFDERTDLAAYEKSIRKLASIAPGLHKVFPSHNIPVADPRELIAAKNAFIEIENGTKSGKMNDDGTELFEYGRFSYLIKRSLLSAK